MPAVYAENRLTLPRVSEPGPEALDRPVRRLVTAPMLLEGAGFPVRRPFPGPEIGFRESDPFLLLDHLGAMEYAPGEAKGAPWHPHRGFETVTYMIDGMLRHHDSQGGGGLITDGATQWMTAGSGILHDEMPTDEIVEKGGLFHGVQLWVNLPRRLKWTAPRYQSLEANRVTMVSSPDGGVLLRLIAGDMAGQRGPGVTWTPITVVHASLDPGSRIRLPWNSAFSALVYVLAGYGNLGKESVVVREGQAAQFGPGDVITLAASPDRHLASPMLEVLLLGGQPIREPIAQYGPFVMNTHAEIVQAFRDYEAGKMGTKPVQQWDHPESAQ